MSIKIGVNGFGRIGRGCLRAAENYPGIEIVAINSGRDPQMLAHLLKYDSTYGPFPGEVAAKGKALVLNGREIPLLSERNPALLNWSAVGAQVVLESTGVFNDREGASCHLKGGAHKVLITAPAKDADLTIVMGVNEHLYDAKKHHIISNASCTTNCLAPLVKALHETFTIKEAFMTTIHAYTNDQRILDGTHKDWRRARAAALSMVPTTTGAARAVGLVLPELAGKINGVAIRVPTATVSLVDLVANIGRSADVDEINTAFKRYAQGSLKDILSITEEPLVSIDLKGNSHSSVVDALSTMVLKDGFIKVLSWYDNEWGYISRVLDLAEYIGKTD